MKDLRLRQNDHADDYVAVTAIAELGTCEHLVRLKALQGIKITPLQQSRIAAGNSAHENFYHAPLPATQDKRCFIATAVFSPGATELSALRRFRDDYLLVTGLGRVAVRMYYRWSPPIASYLSRSPRVRLVMHRVLTWLVRRLPS